MARRSADQRMAANDGWRQLSLLFHHVHEALDSTLQREYRLSLTEYEVLRVLADSSAPDLRMAVIADHVGLSQSAISRLIGRLKATDLVERVVCDDDRRGRYIGITPRGRNLVEAIRPVHEQVLIKAMDEASSHPDIGTLASIVSGGPSSGRRRRP